MEFTDYYAVLNVLQTARIKEIQEAFDAVIENPSSPEIFDRCAEAYMTLINPYKRARYDQQRGYLIAVQIVPSAYPNAVVCEINSLRPYVSLQGLIEKFKKWIEKKHHFNWQEAQQAAFSYHLENDAENNFYLLLRFPTKVLQEDFSAYLVSHKLVKNLRE